LSERDFGIVIGIDGYRKELQRLNGAVQDAEDMYGWLHKEAGVDEHHLWKVVSNGEEDKPDIPAIEQAFRALKAKAEGRTNRRLYVYFAGHGFEPDDEQLLLVTADARLEELGQAIDARAYRHYLRSTAWFSEQFFFYDCCRPAELHADGKRPPFTLKERSRFAREVVQIAHYATRWGSYSYESIDNQIRYRGLFTKALLEGLRGWAAIETDDGWGVSGQSLHNYIARRVKELAPSELNQKPVFSPHADEDLWLVNDIQPRTTQVHVTGPRAELLRIHSKGIGWLPDVEFKTGEAVVELSPRQYRFCTAADRTGGKYELVPTLEDKPFKVDLGGSS
jgi:hypothetical protein